jgi:hypothetical protein
MQDLQASPITLTAIIDGLIEPAERIRPSARDRERAKDPGPLHNVRHEMRGHVDCFGAREITV